MSTTVVTPLTVRHSHRPPTPPAAAVAVLKAVGPFTRSPRRPPRARVVSLVAAVRPPGGGDATYLVANLEAFTPEEQARAVRRLGREMASRWPSVRLFVTRTRLLRLARSCLSGTRGVRVEKGGPSTAAHLDVTDSVGLLARPGTVVLPSRPLVIATDGAFNPATGAAAAAYVTDTGLAWSAPCAQRGIMEAEAAAIFMALEAFPLHDLEVLTDSRPALRVVGQALDGGEVPFRLAPAARHALRRYAGRASLRWVPGHAGHPLNEAADRLARARRRETEGRAVPGSTRQVQEGVRDELLPARASA